MMRKKISLFFDKINGLKASSILFLILIFFLPFQYRYHKALRHLSRIAFSQPNIPIELDRALYFYISDFIMLGMIISSIIFFRKKLRFLLWEGPSKFLLLFLGATFLSALFSSSHSYGWIYYRWAQLALPCLFFLFLSKSLDVRQVITKMFWILLAIALFEGAVAFSQYMHQSAIGLKKLGEINLTSANSAGFIMRDKSRWIFDRFFHTSAPIISIMRVAGTLPHPNIFACFMGLSVFATYFILARIKTKLGQFFCFLFLLIQIFTMFLTFSRAALFGWIGFSGFWFFCIAVKKIPIFRQKALLFMIAISGLLCLSVLYPQIKERGGIVNYGEGAKKSDSDRLSYQKIAYQLIKKHPVIGAGWGNFLVEMEKCNLDKLSPVIFQSVHNIYLLLLAETGLFGLLFFLLFVGHLIYTTIKSGLDLISITLLSMLLYLLWFGVCDHFILTGQHGRVMLMIVSICLYGYSYRTRFASVNEIENSNESKEVHSG